MNKTYSNLKSVFRVEYIALLTGISWATGAFFGKQAMHEAEISSLTGIVIRSFTALVILLSIAYLFGKIFNSRLFFELRRAWKEKPRALLLIFIFEGVLAGSLGMAFFYFSIKGGELILVMPLAFASPLWGTLMALLYRDEKVSASRFLGILITFFGILTITRKPEFFLQGRAVELLQWRIEYIALFTGICWGIGGFFGKRGMKQGEISPLSGIILRTTTGLILLSVVVLFFGELFDSRLIAEITNAYQHHSRSLWIMVLFEGVLAGSLGMSLFYIAIRKGDISLVLPLAFTSPLWSTLLSLISGKENLDYYSGIGTLLVLIGIIFITANFRIVGKTKSLEQ